MKRFLRLVLISSGVLAAAALLLLFGGFTIPLDFLDGRLETLAGRLLQRPVTIHGPVRLRPSLTPTLELGGIGIGNPDGWPVDAPPLLAVKRSQATISLVDLVRGRIRIIDLQFSGAELALVTRTGGDTNFSFPGLSSPETAADSSVAKHELSGLDSVGLDDIGLRYVDEASGNEYEFTINEAHGRAGPDENLSFNLQGQLIDRPCTLELDGGRLTDLLYGGGSWPVNGRLLIGEAALSVNGSFNWSRPDRTGYFSVALSGAELAEIGTIAGAVLPDFTDYSVAADISLLPAMLQVTNLRIGAAELTAPLQGDLIVSLHGDRPQLAGTVTTDDLDLQRMPALFGAPPAAQTPDKPGAANGGVSGGAAEVETVTEGGTVETVTESDGEADSRSDRSFGPLPWHYLSTVDSDLHLRIGQISTGNLRLTELQSTLSLVDGNLLLPLAATLMDIPLRAQVEIDSVGEMPAVSLRLSSPGGKLGPLFSALSADQNLQGRLGDLTLTAETRGSGLTDLAASLAVGLKLNNSDLYKDGSQLVGVSSLALEYDLKRHFSLTAAGALLDRPLDVRMFIGSGQGAGDHPASLAAIDVTACDSTLRFSAGRPVGLAQGASFTVAAEGHELCGLMAPVERFMGRDAPFAVTGSGTLSEAGLAIDFSQLELGRLALEGSLQVTGDENGKPAVAAALHSGRLDLPALLQDGGTTAVTDPKQTPDEAAGDQSLEQQAEGLAQLLAAAHEILAWEMLPLHQYLTTNGRLDLSVEELDTGEVTLADVKIAALVENGALKPSPFQARIGGNLFTGTGAVDTTGDKPVVAFVLATENFVLSELLREFDIDRAPAITIGHVGLDLSFPGSTIQEMLLQADYRIEVRDGTWTIERDEIENLVLSVDRLDYGMRPGATASAEMTGAINGLPLSVAMTGDGLFEKQSGAPIVLDFEAGLADTTLEVTGRLLRNKSGGYAMELRTELAGSRMNSLDQILGTQLPPFGPYRIGGALVTGPAGIGLHNMIVRVGDSSLQGRLDLTRIDEKRAADGFVIGAQGELSAETIQLDDFGLQDWSPFTGRRGENQDDHVADEKNDDDAGTGAQNSDGAAKKRGTAADALPGLLSPELAGMLKGDFSIEVKEVLSGRDNLGGGRIKARVEEGGYLLDDLHLDIPGGAVRITGDYRPADTQVSAALRMEVTQFDYGIMARRVKADTTLKGQLNVDLDLNAEAPTPLELKHHLNGRLRFGVKPIEYQAGVIDLWASNIIVEVLPALLKGEPSVVNCLAGDFILSDGLMKPELFLLDSTKIRVEGVGTVDLKSDQIDFHLRPTPKSAHFFSLATPVTVSGSIYKPNISVTPSAVLKTVFRQLTSVVTVPFQWLFTDSLEADGTAACSAAMQWVRSPD